MFVAVIFLLSLLVIVADWFIFGRYVRNLRRKYVRWGIGVLLVVANLLPYIAMVMLWLGDGANMVTMMWVLTAYTVLAFSRLALYVGLLLVKNCSAKWAVGVTLCTIVASVLCVGVVHTRKNLTVRSAEITSERLPKEFDGYRIVFFSDLHIGSLTKSVEFCRNLVAYVNMLDADLVVFGGDLVNARYDELSPRKQGILGEIESHDGVVAVLGNHDTGVYVRDTLSLPIEENTRLLTERMERMGWRVIDDATECIVRGGDTITLTGIGFSRELLEHRHSANVADSLDLRHIYEGVPRDKFNISVSHMPQLWCKIAELGYGDLVLSGHIHAMQMKLRFCGREYSPAQIMYDRWSGVYREGNSSLYITDGVGSVGFHMRIGAPPEITCLTLRRAD